MARAEESPCATHSSTEAITAADLGRYQTPPQTGLVPFVYSIHRLFLLLLSTLPHTLIYGHYAVSNRTTHPLVPLLPYRQLRVHQSTRLYTVYEPSSVSMHASVANLERRAVSYMNSAVDTGNHLPLSFSISINAL